MLPRSGDAFVDDFAAYASNDLYGHGVLVFKDTAAKDVVAGQLVIPANYVAGALLRVYWTSVTTTGNFQADFDYTAIGGNDAESMDPSGHQESVTGADVAPGTTLRKMDFTIALTAGNFAAGDIVPFTFGRDGVSESTGIADNVLVLEVLFEYTD